MGHSLKWGKIPALLHGNKKVGLVPFRLEIFFIYDMKTVGAQCSVVEKNKVPQKKKKVLNPRTAVLGSVILNPQTVPPFFLGDTGLGLAEGQMPSKQLRHSWHLGPMGRHVYKEKKNTND